MATLQPAEAHSRESSTGVSPQAETATTGPAPFDGLEAETDSWDDDSAVGEDYALSTTSIGSSILKYREENGRTYHAYKVILLHCFHILNQYIDTPKGRKIHFSKRCAGE